jgi:hypothetical protein
LYLNAVIVEADTAVTALSGREFQASIELAREERILK